jgi:pyruvate decarboxylase
MSSVDSNKNGPQMVTIGQYLAERLHQLGVQQYFTVPGDYNLVLLDEFLKHPRLEMISCCNELNATYAADGYARAKGLAAVVLTYAVGNLSAVNAVAGAYAEDLPIIVISGGPNSNDRAENNLIHHSLATHDFLFCRDIYARITGDTVVIDHVADAPALIERALASAVRKHKPVYIEIACNLASAKVPAPVAYGPFSNEVLMPKSNAHALEAAVLAACEMLDQAVKPILVAGVKLRSFNACQSFQQLADASEFGVAVMPNAKSFFPETHPGYMGIYWGPVSSPGCSELVESSDVYLFAGPIFNDYTTTGYTALIDPAKLIEVQPDRVKMPGLDFSHVYMNEFLDALTEKIKANPASKQAYQRIKGVAPEPPAGDVEGPLSNARLMANISRLIDGKTCLVAETGDSWFNGLKMNLPEGAKFEFQMQWGSIGWATPAVLGLSIGHRDSHRVIALIGDGSFQLTAQEVSTMIRYKTNPIIFLINNAGYTIEAEIHDGPYNTIKNWNYADLMAVFSAEDGSGLGLKATSEAELKRAISQATKHKGPVMIECTIDRDDCSKQLLQWGSRVAAANARP